MRCTAILLFAILLTECKPKVQVHERFTERVNVKIEFCNDLSFGDYHRDSLELSYQNIPACVDTLLVSKFYKYGGLNSGEGYVKISGHSFDLLQSPISNSHYRFYHPFRLLSVNNGLKDTIHFGIYKDSVTIKPDNYELRYMKFGCNFYDWTTQGKGYYRDIDYPKPVADTMLFSLAPNASHKFLLPARLCFDSMRLTFKFL